MKIYGTFATENITIMGTVSYFIFLVCALVLPSWVESIKYFKLGGCMLKEEGGKKP